MTAPEVNSPNTFSNTPSQQEVNTTPRQQIVNTGCQRKHNASNPPEVASPPEVNTSCQQQPLITRCQPAHSQPQSTPVSQRVNRVNRVNPVSQHTVRTAHQRVPASVYKTGAMGASLLRALLLYTCLASLTW